MGILDWFKSRPSFFEPDRLSDDTTTRAIEKAVTLTNPRMKLIHSYRERLAPAVDISVQYLREMVRAVPPALSVSSVNWSTDPVLRAFFVAAQDIPSTMGRSKNLRTLFNKYPEIDDACFILVMKFNEQQVFGTSMQGNVVQRDVAQTTVGFSDHEARICGLDDAEVRRLLGAQAYEYLLAQALSEIGDERSERRELEDNRALIRARLRLLQQQGPGLGSVFGRVAASSDDEFRLETQLTENERQIEAICSQQSVLDAELESLGAVLRHPERYIRIEQKQLRLNSMNVLVDDASNAVASEIVFSLAQLTGVREIQRAFVMARFARSGLPEARMNLDDIARYL